MNTTQDEDDGAMFDAEDGVMRRNGTYRGTGARGCMDRVQRVTVHDDTRW